MQLRRSGFVKCNIVFTRVDNLGTAREHVGIFLYLIAQFDRQRIVAVFANDGQRVVFQRVAVILQYRVAAAV